MPDVQLNFSRGEYAERIAKTRQEMARRGIELLIATDPSNMELLTPDDLMAGKRPRGRRVVLYDDDHYYMGGVLAELLANDGAEVHIVTPAADVSNWTHNTMLILPHQRYPSFSLTLHSLK